MNPVTLAFVGDAVYSLYVRERLALSTDFSSKPVELLYSARLALLLCVGFLAFLPRLKTASSSSVNFGRTAPCPASITTTFSRTEVVEAVVAAAAPQQIPIATPRHKIS